MDPATVLVAEGTLAGELVDNARGGQYYSFKGIPYAEPPVGDLRFKAPRPKRPWNGVRKATELGPVCYQFDVFAKEVPKNGSEDCLYLNVYTPQLKPKKPYPVMVWIHGGGFFSGSGNDDMYAPDFLVKHDVIVVTINYRLEVLGFLCLETEDIPGNAGMKDQVAALRWVQRNIQQFGGDPDNVTIFGESAGGASVSYHLVSEMSKGLFKRAIAQSGTCLAEWSFQQHPRERALVLARRLGCYSEDDKELYEFFKSQSVDKLIMHKVPITYFEMSNSRTNLFFSIVDEKLFGNNERFFYGDAHDTLRQQGIHEGVEVLTGYNADEGVVMMAAGADVERAYVEGNELVALYAPTLMKHNATTEELLGVGKKIKEKYLGKNKLEPDTIHDFFKFLGDDSFVIPGIQLARYIARKNKVFLYKFTCHSERNIMLRLLDLDKALLNKKLVAHADELTYLFDAVLLKTLELRPETLQMIENVTKLWTNFAKFGNPTPDGSLGVQFSPYSLTEQAYLDIGNQLVAGNKPDDEYFQFWQEIYRKYRPNYLSP